MIKTLTSITVKSSSIAQWIFLISSYNIKNIEIFSHRRLKKSITFPFTLLRLSFNWRNWTLKFILWRNTEIVEEDWRFDFLSVHISMCWEEDFAFTSSQIPIILFPSSGDCWKMSNYINFKSDFGTLQLNLKVNDDGEKFSICIYKLLGVFLS